MPVPSSRLSRMRYVGSTTNIPTGCLFPWCVCGGMSLIIIIFFIDLILKFNRKRERPEKPGPIVNRSREGVSVIASPGKEHPAPDSRPELGTLPISLSGCFVASVASTLQAHSFQM